VSRSSPWLEDVGLPTFASLAGARAVDVLVIGGGISGLTAACLLQEAGREVLLVEARTLGSGESGRTTAHLTELLDTRYQVLERSFGLDGARAAAESSRAALQWIESFANASADGCGFRRVPAWLCAATDTQRRELERELQALRRVGSDAGWADTAPLPMNCHGAVRVERQAQLHPTRHLRALVTRFTRAGGTVHEHTRAWNVEDGMPCRVSTDRGELRAHAVLVMAHVPVSTRLAFHTKVAPYRTYGVAGPLSGEFPDGLFWDMDNPYHYVRAQETAAGRLLVVGGEDHKTGSGVNTAACISRLEAWTWAHFPAQALPWSWSGQVLEPVDGLPFIGRSAGAAHVYVATGFSGNGTSLGTLAAMLLSDAVLGRENAWAPLYAATRIKPLAQAREFVAENMDFPAHLVRDRFDHGKVSTPEEIPAGEGRLMRSGGRTLALSREENGTLHARSATCTHLGCHVAWNRAERSWDCPCHGSRFNARGEVLNGPATRALTEPSPEQPEVKAPEH
jgi:glycine/D-amino acid oxidase-like deaminating enzyme/nitrite reductase/ring-hydroxylating ferredoxin subunit